MLFWVFEAVQLFLPENGGLVGLLSFIGLTAYGLAIAISILVGCALYAAAFSP